MIQNIIVTRRWPPSVEAELAQLGRVQLNQSDQPFTREQMAAALASADVLCPTVTDSLDAELLSASDVRVKLLANFGVGYNHIDMQAAAAAGIQVTNTPGVLTEATAEIAMTLLLTVARRTGEGERQVRAGAWQGWGPTHMLSTQVTGKTLGIVGMGRIGLNLAHKAHHGFGMQILYHNRNPIDQSVAAALNARRVSLQELYASADFISLNCPATAETRHLIDAAALQQMGPDTYLINTARGDVVDEVALVAALQSGTIAGAGLDVYENEPVLAAGLAELENVVLLPHQGSGTVETRDAMGRCALANVRAFVVQQPLPNEV